MILFFSKPLPSKRRLEGLKALDIEDEIDRASEVCLALRWKRFKRDGG